MDDSDEDDMDDVEDDMDEEIVESDVEVEGGSVEPDNDPPQKVFYLWHYVSYCWVKFMDVEIVVFVVDGRSFC